MAGCLEADVEGLGPSLLHDGRLLNADEHAKNLVHGCTHHSDISYYSSLIHNK